MKLHRSFPVWHAVLFVCAALATNTGHTDEPDPANEIQFNDQSVVMRIQTAPGPNGIRIPRLNSRMKELVIEGQSPLQATLKPEPDHWRVVLPKQAEFPATVVLTTIDPVLAAESPFVVDAEDEGEIVLPAHHAETHGKKLRFEPQPHKNTIGYWTDPTDWASWHFKVGRSGKYRCIVHQGCGKGNGGSLVEVLCIPDSEDQQTQKSQFTVKETGHFQNFQPRSIATFELTPGLYTLEVRPQKLAANAVCDIREIRLVREK